MIDEEEKKKRMERAKQIANSINQNNYSSNFNNIALNRIKANSEEEQAYIDKFQRAREITNSINPRENILPPTLSEEDKIKSQQNAQKFLDLIDNNLDKTQITTENIQDTSSIKDNAQPEETREIETKSNSGIFLMKDRINTNNKEDKNINLLNNSQSTNSVENDTIQTLANMNKRQRIVQINNLTKNKEEQAKLNLQVEEYLQNKEIAEKSNKINEDIANNNYWSSIWQVLSNIPTNALDSMINITATLENLLPPPTYSFGYHDTNDTANFAKLTTKKNELINNNINNSTVRTLGNVSLVIGDMIPAILTNIVAPGSGNVVSAVSSGSSAYVDTLNEDNSNKGKAFGTALLKGGITYGTEKLTGGNFLAKGSLDDFAKKTISSKFSSATSKKVASKIYEIGGEIVEEQIENHLGYVVDKIVNDKGITAEEYWNEFNETNKITFLTTIVLNLLGLGGNTYKEIINQENLDKIDTVTKESIAEATKIIEDENLTINNNNTDNTFYTILDKDIDGNIVGLTKTRGREIQIKNKNLNITPVVIQNNSYFEIIDGESGIKLDSSGYLTENEAIEGFNNKIQKADLETINNINNEVVKSKLSTINKVEELKQLAKHFNNTQINNNISQENIATTQQQHDNITNFNDTTNTNTSQNSSKQNTSTFYSNETKYAIPDIKKITELFNAKPEYTKEEMADVWNDEISYIYDANYDNNGNIQSYIAIEEDGNNLVVNQYDNEYNIIKSEVIPSDNGKYNAEAIKKTIEKVSSLYDENKPIKGQVDIEGNEVRSMKKNKKNIEYNHLSEFTDKRKNSINKLNNSVIATNSDELKKYVLEAFKNTNSKKDIYIGIIPKETIENIKNNLTQIKKENINNIFKDNVEYAVKINQDEIRHINKKESITIDDVINFVNSLDEVLTQFDLISYGKYNKQNALRFEKHMKDGNHIAFTVISNQKQTIRIQSLFWDKADYKNKKRSIQLTPDDKKSPSRTSKTDSLSTSLINNSISQNQNSVKNDTIINNKSIQKVKNNTNNVDNTVRHMKKDTTKISNAKKVVDNQGRELSKEQQEYFKDSKIRDENGNLLEVYHGSNSEFTVFDLSKGGESNTIAKVGFWFTETKEGADNFANDIWYGDRKPNTKEVYLNIKNPKIYENIENVELEQQYKNDIKQLEAQAKEIRESYSWSKVNSYQITMTFNDFIRNYKYNSFDNVEPIKLAIERGIPEEQARKILKDAEKYNEISKQTKQTENEYYKLHYGDAYEQFKIDVYEMAGQSAEEANTGGLGMALNNSQETVEKFRNKLISEGYDGIVIKNTSFDSENFNGENNQYVAFYPEQIKNVDNTNPTTNPDIRFTKKQNKVIHNTPRNAERQESYIEQEIKKIESTGKWDNSIPVTKMSDIRKTIENYLGLGIKKGHFRQQAYAIYKGNRDVIRTKELKDMDSILHETGHALDIGKRLDIDKESIADELLTAIDKLGGYEGESRTIRLEEGFAEVIREYCIIPQQAKIEYPQTVAIIQQIRQNDKSFDNFISKVQQQTYNYIHQNPRNRALSNMSIGEKTDKQPLTIDWVKQEVMRNVYDSDYVIKSIQNELAKKKGKTTNSVKASNNIYLLTRLANASHSKAISMLSKGYINLNGNKTMPGLNKIGEILGNNPERYNDLRAYLVAQRDLEYKSKTLKTGIRTMDSKTIVEQFKNDTQILEAAKVIYDTLDGVLQYAVDNHLIDTAMAEKLRKSNAFYVPMQRVLENDKGNKIGHRGAVADIMKKRTGSELDIKDVLENIVTNSANIIQQVDNNNALKALYNQGEEIGITGTVYDVISTPMIKVGTANLAMWENELKKQGVNTNNLDLEKTIDIFVPDKKIDTKNLITSFIDDNGKRIYLQFNDELTFNAVTGMDKQFMSSVLKINAKMNMPLRYGATMANLAFAIPNMISDTAQASIFSTAGFIPIIDNAIGVLDVLTANNKSVKNFMNKVAPNYVKKVNLMYSLYNQSGATSSTRMSQYRKSAQEMMENVYGTKSSNLGIEDKFKPLKRLLDILTYIPEISDQSTRLRVFEKNYDYYKNKGTSEMDSRIMAAIEARDATQDFSRTGNLTREINQLIPFSAARVGSAYTFAEKVKANPKQVSMRIAILTALAMTIKAIGYDDDEIQELNQRKKDDNFVLKIGEQVITIKKPQGILRSIINLAEYIQDLATGNIEEGKEGERLGEWLNNAIMDNMPADQITGLVPNMVAPLIENAINKDFYYNTDIVKSYDLELPDAEQYYDYNSQLAIWLGKAFNYSPAKIDNLISGYFAGLGTTVTDIMDYILGKTGITAEQPEMGAEDNAVGKRFFVNVNSNSSSVDEIYDRKTELTKMKNDDRIIMSQEEIDELNNIEDAISNISKLNKQIKEIKKDLSMSGKEKAEKIKLLQQEKTDTARKALGKEVIYPENESKIQSTQFYPNDTLKKSGYTLTLSTEQKKEYEQFANNYYSKYEQQGLYSKEKLEDIKSKAKEYAKNEMFKKYKSQLVKTKK